MREREAGRSERERGREEEGGSSERRKPGSGRAKPEQAIDAGSASTGKIVYQLVERATRPPRRYSSFLVSRSASFAGPFYPPARARDDLSSISSSSSAGRVRRLGPFFTISPPGSLAWLCGLRRKIYVYTGQEKDRVWQDFFPFLLRAG